MGGVWEVGEKRAVSGSSKRGAAGEKCKTLLVIY